MNIGNNGCKLLTKVVLRYFAFILVVITLVALVSTSISCSSPSTTTTLQSLSSATPANSDASNQPQFPNDQGVSRPGASGIITQISGSRVTLNAQQGNVMVDVLTDTIIQKTVAATQSDLAVDQEITVLGTADANGNTAASLISVRAQNMSFPSFSPPTGVGPSPSSRSSRPSLSPPGGFNPRGGNAIFGTIVAIDGSKIKITAAQSQQTMVTISSETIIQKAVIGSLSDLHVGDFVSVMGGTDQNGNIQATFINIGSEG
jgi:hypothetical protein